MRVLFIGRDTFAKYVDIGREIQPRVTLASPPDMRGAFTLDSARQFPQIRRRDFIPQQYFAGDTGRGREIIYTEDGMTPPDTLDDYRREPLPEVNVTAMQLGRAIFDQRYLGEAMRHAEGKPAKLFMVLSVMWGKTKLPQRAEALAEAERILKHLRGGW